MASSSRFGLNLFLQLVIAIGCNILSGIVLISSSYSPIAQGLGSLAMISWLSFVFGLIYALFRLFGIRGKALEHYYQNVPIGFNQSKPADFTASIQANNSEAQAKPAQTIATRSFEWEDIFNPRYLRYAGILLIVSAIFSLLFRIDWQLIHKIIASLLVAAASLFGAEQLKKRQKPIFSSLLFLVGFAALQFTVTLATRYCALDNEVDLIKLTGSALLIKFLIAAAGLFLLRRYYADFAPGVYFTILYLGPISLSHSGLAASYTHIAIFVVATSIILLQQSLRFIRPQLMVLNSLIANTYILGFIGLQPRSLIDAVFDGITTQPKLMDGVNTALIAIIVVYALHIAYGYVFCKQNGSKNPNAQTLHCISLHSLAALGVCTLSPWIPTISGQYGLCLLVLSIPAFIISINLSHVAHTKKIASSYMTISIILSTFGLFIETKGPWSAIVFLLYSCGILWYSIAFRFKATSVFAFVALTASLFKLYTECSELFDSIPGSVAIIVVGGILLLLANKMDAIKDFMKQDSSTND